MECGNCKIDNREVKDRYGGARQMFIILCPFHEAASILMREFVNETIEAMNARIGRYQKNADTQGKNK